MDGAAAVHVWPEVADWVSWTIRGLGGLCAALIVAYFKAALSNVEKRQELALAKLSEQFAEKLAEVVGRIDASHRQSGAFAAQVHAEQLAVRTELNGHAVALARDSERWEGVLRSLDALAKGQQRLESSLLAFAGRRVVVQDSDNDGGG